MPSFVTLAIAVALVLAAAILVVIAVRRHGWRGTAASPRERALTYGPIALCIFIAGVLLLHA